MKKTEWPPVFFITGTDTGIGKTVVSSIVTRGLNATYWKPIQAGLEEETDTEFVKRTTALPDNQIIAERYRLNTPMSPHAAAAIDEVTIELRDFKLPEFSTDHLVIEGAGGLMVPINDKKMIIDLITHLDLPVVLVARSTLGTLNHTFLSLEVLRQRDIPVLGVVMNGPKHKSNREAIRRYGDVEIIAEIETINNIQADSLEKVFKKQF